MKYGLRAVFQHIKSLILALLLLEFCLKSDVLGSRSTTRSTHVIDSGSECRLAVIFTAVSRGVATKCARTHGQTCSGRTWTSTWHSSYCTTVPANFKIIDRRLMSRWSNAKRQRYVECSGLIAREVTTAFLTRSLLRVISFNFSCSLTRNITSHSMENLAFHSLLRWKMIILPILPISLIHFLDKRLGECTFWSQDWKG